MHLPTNHVAVEPPRDCSRGSRADLAAEPMSCNVVRGSVEIAMRRLISPVVGVVSLAGCGAVSDPNRPKSTPELVAAWPEPPEAVRPGIVAIVQAATGDVE